MILTVDRIVHVPVPKEIPAEILISIFSYLPLRAIKRVRQVCRDFAAASNQYLFHRVYVSPQELHLEILTAVSQHPVFSKYAKEIVYDCSYFDSKYTSRDALEKVFAGGEGCCRTPRSEIDRYYLLYCRHYDQQEKLIEADADFKTLCEALSKMPMVSTISLIDSWERCGLSQDRGSRRGNIYHDYDLVGDLDTRPYDVPLSRHVIGRWRSLSFEDLPQPAAWQDSNVNDVHEMENRVRGLRTVFRALSLAKHNVQTFFVDSLTTADVQGIPGVFLRMTPDYFLQVCNFFSSLRRIVLQIDFTDPEDLHNGNLVKILESAQLLEDLMLVVSSPEFDVPKRMDQLVGNGTWNNLHSVDLDVEGFEGEEELVNFCSRHRKTLKNLDLRRSQRPPELWRQVLAEIRELNLPLESIRLPSAAAEGFENLEADLDTDATFLEYLLGEEML
ncbi:MAG: hypothetical protein M1812_002399 [Candelaria pacifica]|nr:MAG: hypothetical protein M1812_002399 [Candelaria pacifica]